MFKLIIIFFCFFIKDVNASSCNITNYENYANKINFEFIRLGESNTYEIYVSNITNGLTVESGRWLSTSGFLDYIAYGSTKYVNILVSDGSDCSGHIVKIFNISVVDESYSLNNEYEDNNFNSYNIDTKEENINSNIINEYSIDEMQNYIDYEDICNNCTNEDVTYEPPVINQVENDDFNEVKNNNNNYILIIILLVVCFILYVIKKREKMRKITFLLINILLSINVVNAASYTTVSKQLLNYEINNFYIENNNIIINGWGILDKAVQHFIDSSTHAYYLYLENIYDTNDNYVFDGNILSANKTSLYKYSASLDMCPLNSNYNDIYSCYTRYENVGFEFKIPLNLLNSNAEYKIYLRIDGYSSNLYYQTSIYAPNLNESHEKNGILYEFISDFSTINITVTTDRLFVRSGPDMDLNEVYGTYDKCAYGTRLYWGEYHTFSTLQEVYTTSNNYDSDTWFRLLYNEGLCEDYRSRAIMGYSHSGWVASVHTDFSGTPATIKTTLLDTIDIGDIITYTAQSGEDGSISLLVRSDILQELELEIYYKNNLIIEESFDLEGELLLNYNFELINTDDIKIIITQENGIKKIYETEIFTSSNDIYYIDQASSIINPSTPVMVIKNGDRIQYIYEQIEASIPYNYIKLSSGNSLYAWLLIDYYCSNNNIKLNNDIYAYEKYPSAESSLELVESSLGDYKINLEKIDYNNYQVLYNLPIMYLSNPDGKVYLDYSNLNNYIVGDRKWYTPINDTFGLYNYNIYAENIGVNAITIIFNCSYETDNSIFGNNKSEFIIKRVEVPEILDFNIYKSYNTIDLEYYKERLGL